MKFLLTKLALLTVVAAFLIPNMAVEAQYVDLITCDIGEIMQSLMM